MEIGSSPLWRRTFSTDCKTNCKWLRSIAKIEDSLDCQMRRHHPPHRPILVLHLWTLFCLNYFLKIKMFHFFKFNKINIFVLNGTELLEMVNLIAFSSRLNVSMLQVCMSQLKRRSLAFIWNIAMFLFSCIFFQSFFKQKLIQVF